MGLATLKRDRFTCLRALDGETPSYAVTHPVPVEAEGPMLYVNVSGTFPRRSWVAVEVVDAAGEPLPGYSIEECKPLVPDGFRLPVSWSGGDTGAEQPNALPAGDHRLKFWIFGQAKLHSYWLEK
jgi:hypothetical protein